MRISKRTNKGFFLSVSALSAVGLLAALPISVSAQTETTRDDAAAQTSPASPVADEDMMMMPSGSVTDTPSDGMNGVTRDNAAAETSPASPVAEEDGMMMPNSGGSVVNVESDGMTGTTTTTRDDAAAQTSPASPVAEEEDMMTPSTSPTYSTPSTTPTTTTASPTYNNSPRALW